MIESNSIDSKKKRNLKPALDDVISFQNAFKTDRKAFLDVFFARFVRVYSEYDFARRYTRAEKTGSFASVVFLFFEDAILVSIWRGTFGHGLGQKKRKKELTPLPPLSLTQKILSITNNNNRLSSEVTARSPRRN